jgi:hypothetical protein
LSPCGACVCVWRIPPQIMPFRRLQRLPAAPERPSRIESALKRQRIHGYGSPSTCVVKAYRSVGSVLIWFSREQGYSRRNYEKDEPPGAPPSRSTSRIITSCGCTAARTSRLRWKPALAIGYGRWANWSSGLRDDRTPRSSHTAGSHILMVLYRGLYAVGSGLACHPEARGPFLLICDRRHAIHHRDCFNVRASRMGKIFNQQGQTQEPGDFKLGHYRLAAVLYAFVYPL